MPSYCAVCAFCRCSAEIPSPTFPRKTTASASDPVELANRRFHIGRSADSQAIADPYDAAGGKLHEANRVKRRALRVPKPAQAVVDLLLHAFERLLLLKDRLLLLLQLFFDAVDVPVLEKICNLRQRHIQRPQVSNRIQDFKLLRSVIAVAGIRGNIRRGQKTDGLIAP